MYAARLIGIVASGLREGRCKYCRDRILWVTTLSTPGHPSRLLPFSRPRPWPLRTERNDETGIVFEWWPTASRHRCHVRTEPTTTRRKIQP